MNELTKGKPARVIFTFAIPIFFGNVLQIIYSLTDTRIVGSVLGEHALAAVGATTIIATVNVQFLIGMCNGFGVITARFFGARDYDNVRRSFANALFLGCSIAALLVAVELGGLSVILKVLHVPQELSCGLLWLCHCSSSISAIRSLENPGRYKRKIAWYGGIYITKKS